MAKGVWIDTPWKAGLSNLPGIFLVLPGSNSAYGPFISRGEANRYNLKHLAKRFRPTRRRG